MDVQTEYRVEWTIDITADSPEDAARRALEIQRSPADTATVFDVRPVDGGLVVRVDLDEQNHDEL